MEGCPRLPAISFDPKVSIENVDLCEKIPNYITSNYQENGSKYSQECEQMNRLRQTTINCTADESGIKQLRRYYCQLQLLRNRFPMLPDTECAVRFTWEDAFQKEDSTYNDVRFEEACILYNLGAMHSRLGANESRRTQDSIKNACTQFRYAAACFEKVRDQYMAYSTDFTPDLLTCQVHILLAQAHETVLEKSLLDQRAPSVNAHIAMQISDYYQMALINLTKPGINSIVSKKYREWRVYLTYKLSYYLAVAHFCSGLAAEENKKHGQAVCYYEAGVERLKEAWKNAEKISSDKVNTFKDAHTFTNDVITGKYKAAKRDNDSVYFEKVPVLSSLPAVQGAMVAKPQPFDCHDPEVCGTDIFQKLVPLDTHLATSEYSEEKAKLLREIVELTESKNRELETFLLCLQLNRIPLNNEYLRLPRELLDCCAAVAAHPTMTKDLVSAMQKLNSQHHEVTEQVNDFEQELKTFEETNESIKTNKEFMDLQANLKSVRNMMTQANESNIELHRHMTTIIDHLKILNSPMEQLEKALPVITELNDEANQPKIARLALLNEKVETMKNQREMLINEFRRKIHDDDITKLVLMQRQDNHKTLFSEQVKKHEELVNIIKQNCAAQDNIIQALTEANADVAEIRTKIGATFESRNRLIQEYINSFKSFEDTLSKANEGVEFYKKQSIKLMKLNDRLTTLKSQQQPQLPPKPSFNRQLPTTLPSRRSPLTNWSNPDLQEPDFSLPNLPSTMPDRPRLKDYLAAMKPDTWGSTPGRTSKRASSKRDDNMYMPLPGSNIGDDSHFYTNPTSPSLPMYSSMPPNTNGTTNTSLSNFSSHQYRMQSPIHIEQTSLPYVPPPMQSSSSIPPQHTMARQSLKDHQPYSMNPSANLPTQNFGVQPQTSYTPSAPTVQQPFNQSQQFYSSQTISQPNAQTQQTFHQPPLPTQQYIQQPVPTQQPIYQPTSMQQPMHQSLPAQQLFHQPPPPSQQQLSYPPQPPQQSFHPSAQQLVYQPSSSQPSFHQQPMYQPSSFQQPTYQAPSNHQPANTSWLQQPSSQYPITQSSQPVSNQQPAASQNQPTNDVNRAATTQPSLPPKFDPYRPQPLGTYDIPKSQNPPFIPSLTSPPQSTITPSPTNIHPQDVYRPGGLFSTTQPPMSSLSMNNNSYDINQTAKYMPAPVVSAPAPTPTPPPIVPVPTSHPPPVMPVPTTQPPPIVPVSTYAPITPAASTTTVSSNSKPNPSSIPKISDDLLSLALEQQLEATITPVSIMPTTSELVSPQSSEEDLQTKSNGKPIACIQPLSMFAEEKQPVQPVVAPATSLHPPQDPYSDKEKLDQLVADVQRFEKHVSTMTKKTLNGTIPLEVEWKELSDLQEKDVHAQTCAVGKCDPKLNRFQDLIPYDNSRVRLAQTSSNQQKHFNDYINATAIGRIRDASLIAAQYPLSTTIGEFWSMIYDQHVAIVAVLLRPDELQSINVHPQKIGEELQVSSFTITLLSTKSPSQSTNHKILRLHNSQTNQSRTVVWLEHLGWPPKEMPDNPVELLKFIQEVQHFLVQTRNPRSTILATCMSGVSRTGPFLALFTSIQDIDEGRSFPDLNKIIRLLRSKRRHMIQDMNQLKFVYEALLYYAQDFLVRRGVLTVGSITHHQTSTATTIKSTTSNFSTALFDNEVQTIMEKAKPVVQSTPNYDVGPILATTPTSTAIEEKPPVKQLTSIEENFNLRPEESHIKPKTAREDFFRTKPSSAADLSDPFNQLDPLWTFR